MNHYANWSNALKGVMRVGQTTQVLAAVGAAWLAGDRPPLPRLLRQTFERLGATYVKLGQFVASSPSLFPAEYVQEFQHCLDKTEPLPFPVIRQVIERELKQPLSAVFASVDEQPLASASIAQVHAARLLTGEDVVIKVQKPGVENTLLTDLNFLYVSAVLLERFLPKLKFASLSGIVSEIQACMMEEVNFIQEAENIAQFQAFLQASGNTQAVAPRVYAQASTLRVLTMERFHGVPLTDLDTIRRYTSDPAGTLVTALNTWFSSLMMCQSFHADLHAGNLMVLTDGRLGFIDFGIVGRIAPETWSSTLQFMESMNTGDFALMARSMAGIGMTKRAVNEAQLAADLEAIYGAATQVDPESVLQAMNADSDINQLMMDLVAVGERHGIRFPRAFALLLKQILYFDRYIRILAPEMNLFDDDRIALMGTEVPSTRRLH